MDREQYNSELINAANQGDMSLVAHYLRAVDKSALNRALIEAARPGHENCVEILIPVTDRMSRAGALENAVVQNNVGCVQMIIPGCTPSAFENRALTLKGYRDITRPPRFGCAENTILSDVETDTSEQKSAGLNKCTSPCMFEQD